MTACFPSAEVRWCEVDGTFVLLDLRSGRYLVLDSVAAAIWRALLTHSSVHDIEAAVGQRYEAAPEELHNQVNRFLRRGLAEGILQTHKCAVPPVSWRPPARRMRFALVRAALGLIWTRRSIAAHGFSVSYARLAALARPAAGMKSPHHLEKLLRAFIKAESVIWLRQAPDDCLVRSMALYRLLVSHGIQVRHYIGVRVNPFLAHAWVTYRNRPILDHPGIVEQFEPIARL